MKLRAGIAAAFIVFAVVAVLVLVDKSEVSVAEDVNNVSPDQNTEFMSDRSFWNAVRAAKYKLKHAVGLNDLVQQEPVIVVKKKDLKLAKSVAEEAQMNEDKADEMCRKAKRDVRDHSAASSKAKRDAAIRAMKAFCKKVENVVSTEVAHDMAPLTGKSIVISKKDSKQVQEEKNLFKKTLGKLKFTGAGADKAAKQMATAHALQQMASKALKPDQAKANKACAEAHAMAEAKGGEHTPQGRKALAKAKVYCDKLANVVKNEKHIIMKEVKNMAAGKTGTDSAVKDLAKQQQAQAVATVEAEADRACNEAKEKAGKVASAMAMAEELCKKVKSVVKKEQATSAMPVASKATVVVKEGAAHNTQAGEVHEDASEDASEGDGNVKAVGNMPAKEVKELKSMVKTVHRQEVTEEAKGKAMCAAAKRKVRDDTGVNTAAVRAKAVEEAIQFCKQTQKTIANQVAADDAQFGKLAKHEAQKYGLKVEKLSKKTDSAHLPGTEATTEKDFITHTIGKQGKHMSDRRGLKEAKHEAQVHALEPALASAKKKIDVHIASEEAKVNTACTAVKKKIATLKGKKHAALRMKHLQQAIIICHTSEAIVHKERETDYAQLAKLKHKVENMDTDSKKPTQNSADAADASPTPNAAATQVARKVLAKPINRQEVTQPLDTAAKNLKKQDAKMEAKAASMCKLMHTKVQAIIKHGGKKMTKVLVEKARQQAIHYCNSVKAALEKQERQDKELLAHGQSVMHRIGYNVKTLSHKKETVTKETAATTEAEKKHNAKLKKLVKLKEGIMSRAQATKEMQYLKDPKKYPLQKDEKEDIDREMEAEKKISSTISTKKSHLANVHKTLTAAEKSATAKHMKSNKDCQKILKNLNAMKQDITSIDTVIESLVAMAV